MNNIDDALKTLLLLLADVADKPAPRDCSTLPRDTDRRLQLH
jgi:hypothetical protein